MKRHLIAAFSIVALLMATPCYGRNSDASGPEKPLPFHLGMLEAVNMTGDPALDWIPKGALELIAYSMSYMDDLVLVPLDKDMASADSPLLGHLHALEIRHGLSVALEGTPIGYSLVISTRALETDRNLLTLTLSGPQKDILSHLPEAASLIANSVGYIPDEKGLKLAKIPATTSPEAWRHFTKALYGPIDKSEEEFNAAIKSDPEFAESWARLGMMQLEADQQDKAAVSLSRALRIKPYLHAALYAMASLYSKKEDAAKTEKYLKGLMGISPWNRFFYTARNIDKARDIHYREDYGFLGPDAALMDLRSPVYFEGAFRFLSGYRKYSDALKNTLQNPNTAIRLVSMRMYIMSGLKPGKSSPWSFLESDNYIYRTLAVRLFSTAGEPSACKSAISSLASTESLFPGTKDSIRSADLKSGLISETALAIGSRCDASSEPEIRELLESQDRRIRTIGACLLGMMGFRDGIDGIIEAIPDRDLSTLASKALLTAGTMDDIDRIYNSINKSPEASYMLLATIASFDSTTATSALSGALSNENISIRISAVRALGDSKPESAARLLKTALSDPDQGVRIEAAKALSKIKEAAVAVPELIGLLTEQSPAKGIYLKVLAASGDGQAKATVLNSMYNFKISPEARAEAVAVMSGANASEILPLLSHNEAVIRQAALIKLSEMKTANLREPLKRTLRDPDENVQLTALRIISEKNLRNMETYSAPLINSTRFDIKVAAMDALAQDGGQALDRLIRALGDKDPAIRAAAALALGKSREPAAIQALRATLMDSDRQVRMASARALGFIPDKNSDLALRAVLNDPDLEVSIAAHTSMVRLGERRSIDSMANQAAMTSHYVETLINASRTLGDRGLSIYLLGALLMPGETERQELYDALVRVGSINDIYRHLAATGDSLAFRTLRSGGHFSGNLSILTDEGKDYARAAGYFLLTMKAQSDGDTLSMHKYADRTFKHAKDSGKGGLAVAALIKMAEAELDIKEPDNALETMNKAAIWLQRSSMLERTELYGDLELTARVPLMLGRASQSKGNMRAAESYYRKALNRAKLDCLMNSIDINQSRVVTEALGALGSITTQ